MPVGEPENPIEYFWKDHVKPKDVPRMYAELENRLTAALKKYEEEYCKRQLAELELAAAYLSMELATVIADMDVRSNEYDYGGAKIPSQAQQSITEGTGPIQAGISDDQGSVRSSGPLRESVTERESQDDGGEEAPRGTHWTGSW